MKGRVLGFNGASGAISGEDGTRYSFELADWKSQHSPKNNVSVDFVPEGSIARDVYSTSPSMASALGGVDVSQISDSPGAQRIKALLTGTLAAPLAILILIAFLLPALSSPIQSPSFVGMGKLNALLMGGETVSEQLASNKKDLASLNEDEARLKSYIAEAEAQNLPVLTGVGAMQEYQVQMARQNLENIKERRTSLNETIGRQSSAVMVESLLPLRYLAPLGALVLLWLCWTNHSAVRLASLAVGAAAILAFVLVYALKNSLGAGMSNIMFSPGEVHDRLQALVSVGIGAWLMLASGVALILAALGKIRNPLAKADPAAA